MKKAIYIFIALMFQMFTGISNAQSGCHASFTYHVSGLDVTFTDASTSGNTIVSWFWDFGDSDTSTSQNPTHTYAVAGMYYVCLTIVDSHGCHNTSCQHVTVGVPHPCQASFTFTTDSTGMTFYFTNTSTGTTSSTVYTWDFGDFTTSNLENPTHTYVHSGHYMVCLYITDATTGCHSHYCHTITVHPIHHHHHHTDDHHRQSASVESYEENLTIYPNPVTDVININFSNSIDEPCIILLTDILGKTIYSEKLNLKAGENNLSIPIQSMNVERGIYFLSVSQNQNVTVRKIVIQ